MSIHERTVQLLEEYLKVTEETIAALQSKEAVSHARDQVQDQDHVQGDDQIARIEAGLLRREEVLNRLKELMAVNEGNDHSLLSDAKSDAEAEHPAKENLNQQPEVRLLMGRISLLEAEFVGLLQQLQRGVRERLAQIQKGRTARAQYTQQYTMTEGGFIDRRIGKGE